MRFFRFSFLAAVCFCLGWAPAFAQIATTEPVGFHTLTIHSGIRPVGLPLVRTAAGFGSIQSSSPTVITASSSALNFSQLLNASTSYYVEITEGSTPSHIGDRFDLDVPATIGSANNTLTVATASPNNTTSGNLPDLSGCKFVVRPHLTIGFVFGTHGNTPMHGSTVATEADQLIFWNPALNNQSGGYETYFLYRTPAGDVEEWRKANGGTAKYDDLIIPSGTGMLVNRHGATQVNLVVTGAVRITSIFAQNLQQGLNLISAGYPIDASPRERDYTIANGWTGSTTATEADQVEVWNAAANGGTGGFEPYFLLQSGTLEQWRKAGGGLVDSATTRIFGSEEAIFVRKVSAQPDSATPGALVGDGAIRYDFSSPFLEAGKTSTGSALDETFTFSLGVFSAGFTPTEANRADWVANFSAIGSASWTNEGGGVGEVFGSGTLFGNPGPFMNNAQLYLWGFNSTSLSSTTQWVLLTNPTDVNWKVIADPGGLGRRRLDTSLAGTTAVMGSIGSVGAGADPYLQTAVADVPSTPVPAVPPWAFVTMTLAFFAYVCFGSPRRLLALR